MENNIKKITAGICSAIMLTSNASAAENMMETAVGAKFEGEIAETFKSALQNNPISSKIFCADPTAVEYQGRLYVYGTSDHQQYLANGPEKDNTYEKIKSLVVFSTEDMVNWVYHGEINVGEVAPWIMNAWAPSVAARTEDDGLTHFYLYFSNNGTGVGVITATDPLGPWSDPLGQPLITTGTPGLTDCPNPFDPGVVIDDNGVGWLSFGGGRAKDGTDFMPGSTRIVRLGDDMLSFGSDFVKIPAPYFFEASELNYINGTYVYTYCSDWNSHYPQWDYEAEVPSDCSMVYMTTKTPLDPDSWEMGGECFKNPGLSGFDYSNNHTHMQKFRGEWYMIYHTLFLRKSMGIKGGYRSLCVDKINVDEKTVTIEKTMGSKSGVEEAEAKIPYTVSSGAEICSEAATVFDVSDMNAPLVISDAAGAWTSVKNVMFTVPDKRDSEKYGLRNDLSFFAEAKGSGRIEVRLDKPDGEMLTSIDVDSEDFTVMYNKSVGEIGGVHDLYFIFSEKEITVRNWQFCTEKGFNSEFPKENKEYDVSEALNVRGGFLSFAAKYGIPALCFAAIGMTVGVILFKKRRK